MSETLAFRGAANTVSHGFVLFIAFLAQTKLSGKKLDAQPPPAAMPVHRTSIHRKVHLPLELKSDNICHLLTWCKRH